jgi:DNA end-binding protein Ku
MVKLATQLVDRQTAMYDPSDIEDRYETRLRAMIDAKLAGEGFELDEDVKPPAGNVIDLMAALKRSLGETESQPAAALPSPEKPGKPAKSSTGKASAAPAKPTRKRAS